MTTSLHIHTHTTIGRRSLIDLSDKEESGVADLFMTSSASKEKRAMEARRSWRVGLSRFFLLDYIFVFLSFLSIILFISQGPFSVGKHAPTAFISF